MSNFRLKYTPLDLERARKQGSVIESACSGGVAFTEWLEGPQGAGFALFREPWHTDEAIAAAKRWLRSYRDVAFMTVRSP